MVMRLNTAAGDFETRFSALLAVKREVSEDVDAAVRAIIEDVRARGDEALIALSKRFDDVDLRRLSLRVSGDEIDAAIATVDSETRKALEFAHTRIVAFHQRQRPENLKFTDAAGVELGYRCRRRAVLRQGDSQVVMPSHVPRRERGSLLITPLCQSPDFVGLKQHAQLADCFGIAGALGHRAHGRLDLRSDGRFERVQRKLAQ